MGYTRIQIGLHWAIAALILAQWLTGEAMEDAFRPVARGVADAVSFGPGSTAHLAGGIAVLVLVLARLGLRLRHGAPPPVAALPLLKRLAAVTHWGFYAVLALAPVSGLVAAFAQPAAGGPHGLLFNLLVLLLVLHVAGVLFHAVVLRDGVLKRMLVPR